MVFTSDDDPTPDEQLYKIAMPMLRAIAGQVPGIGPIVGEFLSSFITDPAQKRREEFIRKLAADVEELKAKGRFTPADFEDDSEMSALLLQAIQIATRSAGEEKIEALRSAAMAGVAKPKGKRSDAFVSLGILDRLSEEHIVVLKALRHSDGRSASSSLSGVALSTTDRELRELRSVVFDDLIALGLTSVELKLTAQSAWQLSTIPSQNGEQVLRLSRIARLILRHLGVPDDERESLANPKGDDEILPPTQHS